MTEYTLISKPSRKLRRAMEKCGAKYCYSTNLRSMTPYGRPLKPSDPRWQNAPFEETVFSKELLHQNP